MLEPEQTAQPRIPFGKGSLVVRGSKHRNLGSGANLDKFPGHGAGGGERQTDRGWGGGDITQWWTHELSYSSLASNDEGYTQQAHPSPLAHALGNVWLTGKTPPLARLRYRSMSFPIRCRAAVQCAPFVNHHPTTHSVFNFPCTAVAPR
jgi:hypothetical protein